MSLHAVQPEPKTPIGDRQASKPPLGHQGDLDPEHGGTLQAMGQGVGHQFVEDQCQGRGRLVADMKGVDTHQNLNWLSGLTPTPDRGHLFNIAGEVDALRGAPTLKGA